MSNKAKWWSDLTFAQKDNMFLSELRHQCEKIFDSLWAVELKRLKSIGLDPNRMLPQPTNVNPIIPIAPNGNISSWITASVNKGDTPLIFDYNKKWICSTAAWNKFVDTVLAKRFNPTKEGDIFYNVYYALKDKAVRFKDKKDHPTAIFFSHSSNNAYIKDFSAYLEKWRTEELAIHKNLTEDPPGDPAGENKVLVELANNKNKDIKDDVKNQDYLLFGAAAVILLFILKRQ